DHPLARLDQAIDQRGAPVSLLLQAMHAGARRRGQRRLAAREEGGEQDADQDCRKYKPIVESHRSASFSTRNARTSAASTSGAMKLAPIPRTRMKVSWPRLTFLSWAISSIRRSTPGTPPETWETRVGRPTAARWRSTRSASAAGMSPRRAENWKA